MLVSYRWLVAMLGTQTPLDELLERLVMNGLEVEGVRDLGAQSGKILVGRILEIGPHPNADNLVLCRVDAGRTEPLRIVCGAKNMKVGDLVPVALEGAELPNGLKLKRTKIRGEVSEGMMCSGRELGWSDDQAGLLILPPDWCYQVGQTFDAIVDIKVTPNRPDCLSLRGIARDLAAAFGIPAPAFPPHDLNETGLAASDFASVEVKATADCPRYAGRVIRGVRIAPSPLWLQRAVETAGLRPINNVVDVTNYILVELGHPLHAFDLDRVAGGRVVVRLARDGEEVETLDGQKCVLTPADLLIADPEKPIALAGIMGCGNSEITNETTNVFLECAYFNPVTIRRTSKRLGKSTDSSYRFERGVDWSAMEQVTDRAARLIAEVAGGQICAGRLMEGPGVAPPAPIELSAARTRMLIGVDLSDAQIEAPLTALGFGLTSAQVNDGPGWVVTPPAWRPDISCDADLIEEVARISGYDRIPCALPYILGRPQPERRRDHVLAVVRSVFVRQGYAEVSNYSFLPAAALEACGLPSNIRLRNPLSAEYAALRTGLLPGLLQCVVFNQNHGTPDVSLFETGVVWRRDDNAREGVPPAGGWPPLPEFYQFAAVCAGARHEPVWRGRAPQSDYFAALEAATAILAALNITGWEVARFETHLDPATCSGAVARDAAFASVVFHPGKSGAIMKDGRTLMVLGEIHPRLQAKLELRRTAAAVIGDIAALEPFAANLPQYKPVPTLPSVSRDIALLVDKSTPAAAVEAVIVRRAKQLLAGLRLFDVYEGERIPADKRSLAYSLQLNAGDRTLTDEEVGELMDKIVADLRSKLGAELRQG
ncbi:MAG: phenylalanine--tRNA ligase subunit beta [Candidatus Sumerlaeaceae bacterium]|nr:phenylalanine--tRNA ligase subunit beta [Candidatus Sumerlaeaceae bacterium]